MARPEPYTPRLEALQQLTAALAATLTPHQVAEELARGATRGMGATAVWVSLVDREAEALRAVHAVGYDPEHVATHRAVPLDADLPLAEVARTGEPLWQPSAREAMARYPRSVAVKRDAASVALLPITAGGERRGSFALCYGEPRDFEPADRDYLLTLARICGHALERADRYEAEHRIAETLQRSLLPPLPELPGAAVRARYLSGAAGTQVGGDWYDVFPLREGRIGLVLGDVAGRGVRAASVMGQLRTGLRAYALADTDPAAAVAQLNDLGHMLAAGLQADMATLLYAVYEPASGLLRYTRAGHLPALVRDRDGRVRRLDGALGVPVGLYPGERYETAAAGFEPGEVLVLYSDGLVERRGEPIDAGLARLAGALEGAPDDLEALCDHLVECVAAETGHDDVAILVARGGSGSGATSPSRRRSGPRRTRGSPRRSWDGPDDRPGRARARR